jgi:hypothetical protein
MLAEINVHSQDHIMLNGSVTDSKTNELLVGASIRISGTTNGTQSDLSGQFRLNVPGVSLNDSLIVTYVGYKRYAEPISKLKDKSSLQISLVSQPTTLKEVIVRSDFWRKQYSPEQLKEDYTKFYTIMEKVHTGLFEYVTEREWQALKDSCAQLFTYPMSHSEFYRLIALHVGKVRDMHTRHGVTDWWYKQKQNIFPFNVRYFGDKLYVSESLVRELGFERGCEIIRINGRTPGEIRDMIWPFIPADGFNETGKMASLNDYFPWYFSLFVEEAEQYDIELKKLDGEKVSIATPGLRDSFSHLSFQQIWKWKKSALELTIDQELKAAYFRIEDSRVFKDSIKTYFRRLVDNKVQHLVIDLRGGGGMREEEHVAELHSYLVTKPFRVYEPIQVKSNDYKLFDKDFTYKPYAKSLKQIKETYFDKLVDSGNGYFLWQEESYLGFIEPADVQFDGTVYILTDGRNYSASTDFTSLASKLDNVFIVGEETGGEYRSYISGAMFGLVLPNSKIGVKIPTWKTILAIEEDENNHGRGVIPDYPVSISLDDFISGKDVVKDFTFELIARGQQ